MNKEPATSPDIPTCRHCGHPMQLLSETREYRHYACGCCLLPSSLHYCTLHIGVETKPSPKETQ